MNIFRDILFIVFFVPVISGCHQAVQYDLAIINGLVYDGSGSEGKYVDIGINGDSISFIGKIPPENARNVIDAAGLVVSPGFIDLHAHLDRLTELPDIENFLQQGVTTALGGPDGGGPWPLVNYIDSIQHMDLGINVGFLVGHNRIRKEAMGLDNRKPTADELEIMKQYVDEAMTAGAFGISTGLKYLPGAFSETDEIIELSRVVSAHHGLYTSHLRDEGRFLLEGVKEAIQIGDEANLRVVITHHKVIGKPMWGKSSQSLRLIDSARESGIDLLLDQYPYTASSTDISVLIPSWALEGGTEGFVQRLTDEIQYNKIKTQVIDNLINDRGGDDLRRIQFSSVAWDPSLNGLTLYDLCILRKLKPDMNNAADLVLEARSKGSTQCVFHVMDESDVTNIMKKSYTAVASDGFLVPFGEGVPHPRSYGTFPRIIEKYVKTDSILSLPEALFKMTGLPAEILGLTDRGLIKENFKADIVVINPREIAERGDFKDPHQYPAGIEYVIINGRISLENGHVLGRSGKLLRKTASNIEKVQLR